MMNWEIGILDSFLKSIKKTIEDEMKRETPLNSIVCRSVSSQDGIVIAPGSSNPPSNSGSGTSTASPQSASSLPPIAASAAHKRLSDVGLREEHR